jgi:hypothetical protein
LRVTMSILSWPESLILRPFHALDSMANNSGH